MDRSEISLFMEHAFGRLEAWFQWLNNTQSGICYTSMWDAGVQEIIFFSFRPFIFTFSF
jgi:hypothetical protein